VKICNKKEIVFASETNTFHISYVESKNLMRKQGACILSTYCKSIDTHFFAFLVFLPTHTQIFELCVDRLVGWLIFVLGNFKRKVWLGLGA
jgi:hypothetical protein